MSDSEYASEDAKRYKLKAFRQYRIGMAEIAGIYPDMFIVREMYLIGALPPVFPLPAIRSKVQFKWHTGGRLVLGEYISSNGLGLWFLNHVFAIRL